MLYRFMPAAPQMAPRRVEIAVAEFSDEGLGNYNIEDDETITAARKCGFCMG